MADSGTKPGRRKTPFWQRALPWVAGILLVAGIAAAIQVWVIHPKKAPEVFTKAPVKDVSAVAEEHQARSGREDARPRLHHDGGRAEEPAPRL